MLKSRNKEFKSKILYYKIDFPVAKEIICFEEKDYFVGDNPIERFENFVEDLAVRYKDEPVYVVYDFMYVVKGSLVENSKIILISWAPDSAPIKKKMIFASTKDYLKKSFDGIAKEFHATETSDLVYNELVTNFK